MRNRFKGLDLIECLMNYGQRLMTFYRSQIKTIPMKKKMQKSKMSVWRGLTCLYLSSIFKILQKFLIYRIITVIEISVIPTACFPIFIFYINMHLSHWIYIDTLLFMQIFTLFLYPQYFPNVLFPFQNPTQDTKLHLVLLCFLGLLNKLTWTLWLKNNWDILLQF